MDELMGPAFIEPAHIRVIAEQLKHRIEFAQVLFALGVAEVFEGVAVNVFQIAFGAMRYSARASRIMSSIDFSLTGLSKPSLIAA
ncbi:hypothetical protein [Mesorhizobium sp. M7A.F.Ca.US.011.01.1.1]|uniref:hypothetical protein n=1 Tax=Mesorhizobium sp. M7A.F.Ca.US.011.01.1.1 TaxID=2496741 RepID=UPI001FE17548|nr:hypothetical protein [Mesorhizobium sp. M7A.F.Ca.US.011.01.1.1]